MVSDSVFSREALSYAITHGCICVILSLIISYIRPCKSLIMNMSLSFHHIYYFIGTLGILVGLWGQNFLVNTEAVAIGLAILPHIMIMIWTVYNIISKIQLQDLCHLHNLIELVSCMRKLMQEMMQLIQIP